MKLYHFSHSSASYRVRIALALKELDVTYQDIDLRKHEQTSQDYARINPQRMVPCLETGTGRLIPQSLAIIDYLDDMYPDRPLTPSDPEQRAIARSLAYLLACEAQPFQAPVIARYLQSQHALSDQDIHRWNTHWLTRAMSPIETFLASTAETNDTPFAMGDAPGLVECCLIPQMRNLVRFNVDVSHMTHLHALDQRCMKLPAFRDTLGT